MKLQVFTEFNMEAIRELLPFLEIPARIDLKVVALQHILGLTGSPEGLELLSSIPELVKNPINFLIK